MKFVFDFRLKEKKLTVNFEKKTVVACVTNSRDKRLNKYDLNNKRLKAETKTLFIINKHCLLLVIEIF